ncbi:MAG: hypothetical protein J7M25_07925 [Deltaproteobacteria bacterium]|nr:hypothetical protein [Deltaproteobacteria bacterium]
MKNAVNRDLALTVACVASLVLIVGPWSAGCSDDTSVSADSGVGDGTVSGDGSATRDGDPGPGPDGKGTPCPEPIQKPVGSDWPEVFVGRDACDDNGQGTRDAPFCTFTAAFDAVPEAPAVVTVLDGQYRLVDSWPEGKSRIHLSRPGTADAYFLIRADEGAMPVLIGSVPIAAGVWQDAGNGLWRTSAEFLEFDPTGLWTTDETRIIHVMEMRNGVRSHANTSDVMDPGTWTKADDSGTGCGRDNQGCFLYIRPPAGMDMTQATFEASQGQFLSAIGCPYMVMEGLTFRYTQPSASHFEGSDYLLVQDNDFGHNANGDDNSYSIFIAYSQGVMVRRNLAHDSRYWGGNGSNSKGITFMVSGDEADLWACSNEVWGMLNGGITTKGGVSNLHVVGNWIHDVGQCIQPPGPRCNWKGCDGEGDEGHTYPGGNWTIRENILERCGSGIAYASNEDSSNEYGSRVFNNLFIDCKHGIHVSQWSVGQMVRNNAFIGSGVGIYFNNSAGEKRWPDWFLNRGFDSDFNVFHVDDSIVARVDWTGSGDHPLTLDTYRASYAGETHSLEANPSLDASDQYKPLAGSPCLNTGDPSVYKNATKVNIGLWPFFLPDSK